MTPHSLADEIWADLEPKPELKGLLTFVPAASKADELLLPAGQAHIVKNHLFQPDGMQFGKHFIELGDPARCEFVKLLSDLKLTGKLRVPADPTVCRKAMAEFRSYIESTTGEYSRLAAAHTADETMQERVVRDLWRRVRSKSFPPHPA